MFESPSPAQRERAFRYDFESIDLDSGSVHADVVLLVGENRRVLELGPATGYMSRVLTERGCSVVGVELDARMGERAAKHCERVIIGDIESLDWDEQLGDERFDAIVAADVLEHLRDPLRVLRALRPFLSDDGFFVISVPNVAHGSVRLALLGGRFDYQDVGLLDRTHVSFFTRQTLEQMLDDAELGVVTMNRHDLDLEASEVPFDPSLVSDELRAALESDPDARTYQFVVKAVPMPRAGLRELQRQLRDLVEQRDVATAELEAERARAATLEQRLNELERTMAEISGREGELRKALVDAHDQLLRRDAERELEQERDARIEQLEAELQHANALAAARGEELLRLQVRLDRIQDSLPARVYGQLRDLPGFRHVVARRTAAYAAELEQRKRQHG